MSNFRGVFVVRQRITTVAAAQTLIQIAAGATTPLELLRATFTMETTVSDDAVAQILRKTAAATVTSFTPLKYNEDSPLADAIGGAALTGVDATVEGTDGDILWEEGFNSLNGFVWVPTLEERMRVQAAGFIALKSALAITSVTVNCAMVFGEV